MKPLLNYPDIELFSACPSLNQTNCPYLIGYYGRELAGYMDLGYGAFIPDVTPGAAKLGHIRKAFDYAMEETSTCRKRYTTG